MLSGACERCTDVALWFFLAGKLCIASVLRFTLLPASVPCLTKYPRPVTTASPGPPTVPTPGTSATLSS
jgi:hypothetical protein